MELRVALGSVAVVVSSLVACGPEPVARVELEEVCGEQGPFRVLPLAEDEQLSFPWSLEVGDRVLYLVRKFGPPAPDSSYPTLGESTVWSTGPCGESPVKVATGVDDIFTLDVWPGVALACMQETGDVVAIDPHGAREPHVVFAGIPNRLGCGLRWTDHGVLQANAHDEDLAALQLYPYPADPWAETAAPQVLVDPVRITPSGQSGTGLISDTVRTFPDFVLALNEADELVRVDLATRAVTVVQSEVASIQTSFDGRYLLWQDSTVTQGAPEYPEGKVFLRDLQTGTDALLAETSLRYSLFPLSSAGNGIVQLGLAPHYATQRIFFLPGLEHVDIPVHLSLTARIDEERWLGGVLGSGYFDVIDLRKGESRRLFPRQARYEYLDREAGVFEVIELPPCCVESDSDDEGPLWRVPLDGSPPQLLAESVSAAMWRLEDGRRLGSVRIDERQLGELVVFDPEAGTELRVDDRVSVRSVDARSFAEDGIVQYSVSNGERSGVYLAKLPQAKRSGVIRRGPDAALDPGLVRDEHGRVVPRWARPSPE